MMQLTATVNKHTSTGCILCVVNVPRIWEVLAGVLQGYGFSVESSPAPDRGLQLLSTRQYDLLFVACDGGTSSAVELVRKLKHRAPQTPVVLLVERGDVSTAVRAIKAGAADCIEKPIEAMHLVAALDALLQQRDFRGRDGGTPLTKAEIAVLHHVLEGRTNREIAGVLSRSRRTIEAHRYNLMRKLGAATVVDLVKKLAPWDPCNSLETEQDYPL
ncbi:MAG: response regulator [Planctomycetes bacterium]|nr:response regulator [Planctomycetota bacterium]